MTKRQEVSRKQNEIINNKREINEQEMRNLSKNSPSP